MHIWRTKLNLLVSVVTFVSFESGGFREFEAFVSGRELRAHVVVRRVGYETENRTR